MIVIKILNVVIAIIKSKWYRIINKSHFKNFRKDLLINGRIICLGNNIEVGNRVTINEGVFLNSWGGIKIGNYCRISPYVQIHTGGLKLEEPYEHRGHYFKPVVLGDGVWLGAGVIINPDVTIGKGSVIASGAVVTKNVPEFELWGGVPASKIKDLKKH